MKQEIIEANKRDFMECSLIPNRRKDEYNYR